MSTCVEKLPCKDCKSSDSLQTYLNIDKDLGVEWYTSFCHGSCWENKGDPYTSGEAPKVHVKTEQEIKEEVAVVTSCPLFVPKRNYRGLPASCFRKWGLRVLYNEFDGKTPYSIGFPCESEGVLTGWKCRPLTSKDFYSVGKVAGSDPFGFTRAIRMGTSTMFWTEGEYDAIALDYCLAEVGKRSSYPVVSLTHGGGSLRKNFSKVEGRVGHIKYHVLVLDDDEVGKIAEKEAIEIWGNKVILVRKPKNCKDANDAVKTNKTREMGLLALNYLKK